MTTTVSIPGIHCPACAALITDVSGDFPSIARVSVDLDSKHVSIEHDDHFDLQAWQRAIEDLNPAYKVHPVS